MKQLIQVQSSEQVGVETEQDLNHMINCRLTLREAGLRVQPNLSRYTVASIIWTFCPEYSKKNMSTVNWKFIPPSHEPRDGSTIIRCKQHIEKGMTFTLKVNILFFGFASSLFILLLPLGEEFVSFSR